MALYGHRVVTLEFFGLDLKNHTRMSDLFGDVKKEKEEQTPFTQPPHLSTLSRTWGFLTPSQNE
jgi:hypothetical protein